MRVEKEKNYRPTEKEPFMNDRQREYFRTKLLAWREDCSGARVNGGLSCLAAAAYSSR